MKELYKNGSGYTDPTAGKALKTVGTGNNVKRGEIWSAYFGNAERRLAILAVSGEVVSVLLLNDESKGMRDKAAVTESGRLGYYLPHMLTYKFVADLDKKVDSLEPSELDEMLGACGKVLGLPATVPAPAPVKAPDKTEQELREEIIRLTAARDLYREEYRELLAALTGK